ncbi:phosphohydrolase [Paenibacillus sp. FSL R7-0273]|uniref:pyridoxamine 5'-phosphate oxidase family protein n=1 Tax=Paenibacillus sp. FSL R7-0273 TaxID=1536772 RepID=UPI0004F6C5E9|nr:pyridoxamine 5'-phosphate oxidase family protein [Paenibacillus sp. FSL R7-0273]AIQ47522.1 phosphohydrolase [Paenibacillus sp. FSL R7-0273]OMF95919.1 phosphohydrolase [Paenibacillus sp. FSL R7-0273]
MSEYKSIGTEAELRELLGYPGELVQHKVIGVIDEHCRGFIAQSPILMLATSDHAGHVDVSPRGDAPGFALVLDEHRLVIPERPGNRRMDSLINLLSNPRAGLIFMIPGLEETLRVNGRASIVRDEQLLQRMEAHGRRPLVGILIEVEECYTHCAKAFKRSSLWNPQSWPDKEQLPDIPKMIADHVKLPGISAEQVSASLNESYTKRLY